MKNEAFCWKEYIRRCMVSKTCTLSEGASNDQKDMLEKIIFPTLTEEDVEIKGSVNNSIMTSYQRAFQHTCNSKKCKMAINEERKWQIVATNVDDETDTTDDVKSDVIECELHISVNQNLMEAIPCNGLDKKPIRIARETHRRGAFNDDIVSVKIIGEIGKRKQKFGKVVSVLKPRHQTRFVCRSSLYRSTIFYPLDKSVPGIVNLPKMTNRLIKYHKTQYHRTIGDNSFITVFCSSSLHSLEDDDNDTLPQIKELIPCDMANSLYFVVQILGWSPKYRLPLGAVIEALPRTSNLFFTERLLKVVYDVIEAVPGDCLKPAPVPINNELPHYKFAFTIDQRDTVNMDDALSLTCLEEPDTYELAVHISNVASYIHQDSPIDILAKKRGTSIYGTRNRAIHMLPISISTENFSLKPNLRCSVLTVSAKVVMIEGEMVDIECDVSDNGPKKATVTSLAQLSYETAQKLMDNEPLDDEIIDQVSAFDIPANNLKLKRTLKLLYSIATKLQEKRIGASYPDEKDEREFWQAKLLVSEIMIWTNAVIAEYLVNSLPNMALVRRQLPPLEEKIENFKTSFNEILPYSLALKSLAKSETLQPLILTSNFLSLIHKAQSSCDYKLILWALSNDFFCPQLAQAHTVARMINRPAEYIAKLGSNENADKYRSHYDLKLAAYTHFTSPIRRYFDLLVQRILIALIDGSDIHYTPDELEEICQLLNRRTKMAQKFDRALSRAKRVQECESSSFALHGFLAKCYPDNKVGKFQIVTSDQDKLSFGNEIDTTFDYSHLSISSYEEIEEPTWRFVILKGYNRKFDNDAAKNIFRNKNIGRFVEKGGSFRSLLAQDSDECKSCTSVESSVSDVSAKHSIHLYAQAFEYLLEEGKSKDQQQLKRTLYETSVLPTTHEVDYELWHEVQDCVKSPSKEKIASLIERLPKLPTEKVAPSQPQTLLDSLILIFDVKRSFKLGEELTVKIGKSLSESLPTPCIQSMEIAPGFQVCLQHNRYPSSSFSDVQLQKATKQYYNSIEEYIDLWSKVLVAEGACNGVTSSRTIYLVKDIQLQWPELLKVNNLVDDEHYEPVKNGEVSCVIDANILNYIKVFQVGDLICARYEVAGRKGETIDAVYHFVITQTKPEKENKFKVIMKSVGYSCQVSETIKDLLNGSQCDLQVIEMPVSFR